MNEKQFKKVVGTILYECSSFGFECSIDKIELPYLFVKFNKKYLQDFYFIFTTKQWSEDIDIENSICEFNLYVVPTNSKDYVIKDIDAYCNLKLKILASEQGISSHGISTDMIIKFLRSFKQNYKKYFYTSVCRYYSIDKLPYRNKVNKFYKKYKPVN